MQCGWVSDSRQKRTQPIVAPLGVCEGGTGGVGGGMVGGSKLNATGRTHHSAAGNGEDVRAPEAEHTSRRCGGGGGATPRKPRWTLDVRWYAELMAVADKKCESGACLGSQPIEDEGGHSGRRLWRL